MFPLATQRCLNHALREAVARCPGCLQFYCRECVTEHEDRVMCAACLKKLTASLPARPDRFRRIVRAGLCAIGIAMLWFFFFLLGQALLGLPTSFREGTIWDAGSGEAP